MRLTDVGRYFGRGGVKPSLSFGRVAVWAPTLAVAALAKGWLAGTVGEVLAFMAVAVLVVVAADRARLQDRTKTVEEREGERDGERR